VAEDFSPYVGPRPFERADRDRFFGRDAEIHELLSLVVANQAVLLYAASGAGKTSLLRAGLLPLLEARHAFEVLPTARVRELRPRTAEAPEEVNVFVSAVVASWIEGTETESSSAVNKGARLYEVLAARPHPHSGDGFPVPRAVVIDQLEEIFTVNQERWTHREDFFAQLAEALDDDPLLRVILAIREDHVARLDRYTDLLSDQLDTRFRLELLDRRAAIDAVTGPLRNTDFEFAPGVPEQLVDDLRKFHVLDEAGGPPHVVEGEYVEPVHLQIACEALWGELPPDVHTITAEHLREFADVDDVLRRFYSEAIQAAAKRTGMEERLLRAEFEEAFITPLGTRGTVYLAGDYAGGIPEGAISELERRHVIRAEWRSGARWFELTHDRLIEPVRASNDEVIRASAIGVEREAPVVVKASRGKSPLRILSGRGGDTETPYAASPSEDLDESVGGSLMALCLSGGGYRSMLFDAGAMMRLNEAGYLARVDRVAAVSGGAIAAAQLGAAWRRLHFDADGVVENFTEQVLDPLRGLARRTIDIGAMVGRFLGRGGNEKLADALSTCLFGDATLRQLPERPEIVIVAANLTSGRPYRMSRRATGNELLGWIAEADVRLADAVAASSALPPALSPAKLKIRGNDGDGQEVELTDGGVFDSLAVETVWRRFETVLVSDGKGQRAFTESRSGFFAHLTHLSDLIAASDNELRALRRREVLTAYLRGEKRGTYWNVANDIRHFGVPDALPCPREETSTLAAVPSRLSMLGDELQERLINWGYAVADAAVRGHFEPTVPPSAFPFPETGVGPGAAALTDRSP
jgi:predicted acylesterase/phospholipase RssA